MASRRTRVLVTGSTGMLGRAFVEELGKNARFEVAGLSRKPGEGGVACDLTKEAELSRVLRALEPEVIINCAALVSLDQCERDPEAAHAIHVRAPQLLAEFRPERTRMIQISTDSVFSGETGNYREQDSPSPVNGYARSKRQGEIAVLEANPRAVVVRTNLYGFHVPPGTGSLAEWAISSWNRGETIRGFTNVRFNPLYSRQIATIVVSQLDSDQVHGILHLGCREKVSKLEFLRALAEAFGVDPRRVDPSELQQQHGAGLQRPLDTTLNTDGLQSLTGSIPTLRSGLETFAKDWKLLAR